MPLFSISGQPSYQQAIGQLGIRGKNPFNTLLRMAGLAYGGQLLDDMNFSASLAPDRQNWIRYGLGMAAPTGSQARIDAFRNQSRASAQAVATQLRQASSVRGDRSGDALAQGLAANSERDVQAFVRQELSPETQLSRVGQSLSLIDAASQPQGLSLLASLAGQLDGIVGRQQARQRSQGSPFGGLLQTAAQLYGMGAFGGGRFTPGINGG